MNADIQDLETLLRARTPVVMIESHEEQKVTALLERFTLLNDRILFTWNLNQGLRALNRVESIYNTKSLPDALHHVEASPQNAIYLFFDAHPFLEDPMVVRTIKNIAQKAEVVPRMLVFMSHQIQVPKELSRLATTFKPSLPDAKRIQEILNEEAARYRTATGTRVSAKPEALAMLVQHLGGLSEEEARRLARMVIRDDGQVTLADIGKVLKAKHEYLQASEILALEPGIPNIDELGGLANLKRWLKVRREIFLAGDGGDDNANPLPPPKGVLLLGVQGAGKSLAAKCVAGAWHLPLFRLDFGTLYQKYHGETERNMREALSIAAAMSPCVLWMDEIEKGIGGDASGSADGGVSRRVLGTLLTWMAERRARVFMVATANDISQLPPELLRKGRFDEIFFVDLPGEPGREQIFKLHLAKRKCDPVQFDLRALIAASNGFSGAEIEQAIISGLYEAHAEKTPLSTAQVVAELRRTRPISVVMSEKITELRAWAKERAVSAD
ncbi:MAG: AAA family ATPase [Betaproteobacteria bacterium]|nr:AAA family ATPase [Betaproteobacteria bacterium]